MPGVQARGLWKKWQQSSTWGRAQASVLVPLVRDCGQRALTAQCGAPRVSSCRAFAAFTLPGGAARADLDFMIYLAHFIMFLLLSSSLPLQLHSSLWGLKDAKLG